LLPDPSQPESAVCFQRSLIADCGHIIPLDRPQELLRLLLPFLGADHPSLAARPVIP
jgi:hypothetical protein